MLFAHGARFGGHALYVKDGMLKYVYNWVGTLEQIVESTEPTAPGHVVVSATFDKEGDSHADRRNAFPPHPRPGGRRSAGSRRNPASSASPARASMSVSDGGEPVTDDFPGESPWAFTGGTINRALVDVSGEPFIDLANEAAAMFTATSRIPRSTAVWRWISWE